MPGNPTTPTQTLPEGVYCLPALPPEVDATGAPVGELGLLLHRTTDGRLVADVYSSPARLATARGQLQTWVAVRSDDLAELLDRAGVDEVVLDAASPEAMHVSADGTVTALEQGNA
jgi:SseB protein N-terminal domain